MGTVLAPSVADILNALDDEQKQAVVHVSGPALVLAGPGAGKTRTLTHHAALLVAIGVPAESILVCTFTRKATHEMEDRLAALIGTEVSKLALGTIHATCYRLLREYWRQRGERVREVASDGMIHTIATMLLDKRWAKNEIGMDLGSRGVTVRDLLRLFSAARDRLLAPQDVRQEDVPGLVGEQRWREIQALAGRCAPSPEEWVEAYARFQRVKAERGLLDFDDMAPALWEAWRRDPGLLAAHQARFQHVLIDEFQDTSYGQWQLLRTIAEPQNNVFAVGDVDQSMYSFRFARPEFAIRFQDYYGGQAKVYYVRTNYRSLPEIVSKANTLIAHNRERLPMTLRPYRGTLDDATSAAVSLLEPEDDDEEAEFVAAEIERCKGRWNDVAVLYRCNWYSAKVELALLRHQVPYRVVGGLSFFEHKPVADMLAYLRLAEDPTNAEAFARAMQAPSRYLGREFLRAVQAHAGIGGDLLAAASGVDTPPRQREAAQKFVALIRSLPESPAAALKRVRSSTGYDAWFLQRGADDESETDDDRLGILDELEHVASAYSTRAELLAYVDAVLESARDNEQDDAGGNRVTLSTIHRAKGLEWPLVYVLGMVDGLLPHVRSYSAGLSGIEEERRIAYVAVTRAKDRLVLSRPLYVGGKPADPSPFLSEIGMV